MRKKRKPHQQRKPEDYREAAEDSLELAKVPAGEGGISGQLLQKTCITADSSSGLQSRCWSRDIS